MDFTIQIMEMLAIFEILSNYCDSYCLKSVLRRKNRGNIVDNMEKRDQVLSHFSKRKKLKL